MMNHKIRGSTVAVRFVLLTHAVQQQGELLLQVSLPCTGSQHSMYQISCPFSIAYVVSKYHSRSEAYCMNVSYLDVFGWWGVVSTLPNPQAGGPPLFGCLRLLQYIHSYPPYWKLFLHLQTEDAPCRCDRDPLIIERGMVHQLFIDFKELYDTVRREVVFVILIEFVISMKLIRFIKMCLNEHVMKSE